jgi:hypothetical protein
MLLRVDLVFAGLRRDLPSSGYGMASRLVREKQDRPHFTVFQHAHQVSSNFGLRLLIFRKVSAARTL